MLSGGDLCVSVHTTRGMQRQTALGALAASYGLPWSGQRSEERPVLAALTNDYAVRYQAELRREQEAGYQPTPVTLHWLPA